jgi:hypothetical protein
MSDDELAALLSRLPTPVQVRLREALVADQGTRDDLARSLLRRGDPWATDLADLLDLMTLYPDARRSVVRILGELSATG